MNKILTCNFLIWLLSAWSSRKHLLQYVLRVRENRWKVVLWFHCCTICDVTALFSIVQYFSTTYALIVKTKWKSTLQITFSAVMFYFFTWQYVMQHLAGQVQIFFMGRYVYYFRKSVIVNGERIFFFKNRYPDSNMIITVLRIYLRMFAKDLKTVLNLGKCCLKMYHKPVQIFSVRYKVCSLDIRLLMYLSQ